MPYQDHKQDAEKAEKIPIFDKAYAVTYAVAYSK